MTQPIYQAIEAATALVNADVVDDWVYIESAYRNNPHVGDYIAPAPGGVSADDTIRIYSGNAIMVVGVVQDEDLALFGITTYHDINELAEGDFADIEYLPATPEALAAAVRTWSLQAYIRVER